MDNVVAVDEYGNILSTEVYAGDNTISLNFFVNPKLILFMTLIIGVILAMMIFKIILRMRRKREVEFMSLTEIISEIGEKPYKVIISECGRRLATFFFIVDGNIKAVTYEIDEYTLNEILKDNEIEVEYNKEDE